MIDRDKVISRLQIIRTWAEVGKSYNGIQGEGCLRDVIDWIDDALVLLKEQERTIVDLRNVLQLIADIAYDYDGYNSVEGLKSLIDEIKEIAIKGVQSLEC